MNVYHEYPCDVAAIARENIASNNLLADVCRLGLAVSGGADSIALLETIPDICAEFGVSCTVLFVHHGRDGEDEARELVRAAAKRKGVPFLWRRRSIEGLAKEGASIENAAREVRMDALSEMVDSKKLDAVATAHHADDVAETLLLRLARGSGLSGLAGIRWRSDNGRIRVIRPLLTVSHSALCSFLKERNIFWTEDPDNADLSSMRVRMRRGVIPEAEKILEIDLRKAICRSAEFLREEEDCAVLRTGRDLKSVQRPDGALDARKLMLLPLAARRRVLREWMFASDAQNSTGWQTISGIVEKIAAGGDWAISLGRTMRLISRRGRIVLERW